MLNIVADENIPLVENLFGQVGKITLLPGREINHQHLKNANILLVRSVTPVNAALLANTPVRFVGSATTGIDHVDTQWLQQQGISFADAKGCNAEAVAEYVVCCIAALQKQGYLKKEISAACGGDKGDGVSRGEMYRISPLVASCEFTSREAKLLQDKKLGRLRPSFLYSSTLRAGIVGVGRVGQRVATHLRRLGFDVLLNDPPRAENEADFISTPLTEFYDLDLICLHTPLTKTGSFPTYQLFNAEILEKLKPGAVVLNAGRGAVIDFAALKIIRNQLIYCLDVWENEPQVDAKILVRATIATPHIGGYTVEAKMRGTLMLYQAAQSLFSLPELLATEHFFPNISLPLKNATANVAEVLLQLYDPQIDTAQLKNAASQFDYLRNHYPERHEFSSVVLTNAQHLTVLEKNKLKELGFRF